MLHSELLERAPRAGALRESWGMQDFLRHRKSLLCIDDQQNALAGWCLYLQGEGYRVTGAASAQEGLEIFATQNIDAVVLDYVMPDLSGDAVAATMKRMKPSIPIIMFTGVSEIDKRAQEQVDAFVTKGCPPNVLLKTIDALLQIHGCAAS